MSEKYILDATAGFRMMWENKEHPHVVYSDIRPECNPNIISDYRDLKEFKDETFRLVVLDPPHHIKPLPYEKKRPDRFTKCYGSPLSPETWPSDIKKGITESLRVLKPFGILLFKWTTIHIKIKNLIEVFPVIPLFGHKITSSKQ